MEVLVTGATGLLGQRFVKELIQRDDVSQVYVIVRDKHKAEKLFKRNLGVARTKLVILLGDITHPLCGLSTDSLAKLAEVSHFYHLAAIVHLGQSERAREKLKETNILGTSHALEVALKLKQLHHFIFVSTAYAAGNTQSIVPEESLSKPRLFRCPYEASKWECERLVTAAFKKSDTLFSIVRPSILLDSTDNAVIADHTIYLFSNFMSHYAALVRGDLTLIANLDATLNFVFVDDLVTFLLCVGDEKQARIYNFVSAHNVTIGELFNVLREGLRIKQQVNFLHSLPPLNSSMESKLLYKTKAFIPYLTQGTMHWSRTNTERLLRKYDFTLKNKQMLFYNLETYCNLLRRTRPAKLKLMSLVVGLRSIFK